MMTRAKVWTCLVGLVALGAQPLSGQTFPSKPVRIVTDLPGGGTDFVSRLIAQGLASAMGQQVIVDNRAGYIKMDVVSKSPPDGYTVLTTGSSLWISPLLQDNLPWDPVRDFAPITVMANSPHVVVVHPSLPVKSVKELITLARKRPGEINYGTSAAGGSIHLAAELFKAMAALNMVRVAYRSNGPAISALIAGEIQLMFPNASAIAPHVKADKVRALAVTSTQPSVLVPGVPTVAATGLPGYEAEAVFAVFAPAKTPAAIISRLNQEMARVINSASMKDTLFKSGLESQSSSPEELSAIVKSDIIKWSKVIKDARIRAE